MRPITLKITGINSFVNEQIVDFETLTGGGLFGIFGQTGSGKSSILDGIVLALYGPKGIPRDTKDFINTECEKGVVYFEFKIGSAEHEKTVISQRVFKRTKTGVANNAAKLSVINHLGETEKIVDKTSEIDGVLEELIGLSASEFTRTVFLPQGKFSSFLKLTGLERRRMLENILGLHEYGQKLTEKIKARKFEEDTKALLNNKELEPLEHLNKEYIKEIEDGVNRGLEDIKNQSGVLNEKKKIYDKYKLILTDMNQLEKFKDEKNLHQEKEAETEVKKEQIKIGKKANVIDEMYKKLIKLRSEHEDFKNKESSLLKVVEILESEKNIDQSKLEVVTKAKEIELPELKIKIEKYKEAIKLQNERDELVQTLGGRQEKLRSVEVEIIELLSQKEQKTKILVDNNSKIDEKSIKQESVYVSPIRREEVQKVYQISKEVNKLKSEMEETNINLTNEKTKHDEMQNKSKELNDKYEITVKNHKSLAVELTNDKKQLEEETKVLHNLSIKLEKETAIYNELLEKMKLKRSKKVEISRIEELINKIKEKKELIKKNLEKLSTRDGKIKEFVIKELKKNLKSGEECPVCGSKEHSYSQVEIEEVMDSSDYELEIKNIKEEASLREKITSLDNQLLQNRETLEKEEKIINLDFSQISDALLTSTEQNVEKIKEELSVVNTTVDKLTKNIENKEKSFLDMDESKIQIENIRHEEVKKHSILSERVNNLEILYSNLKSKFGEKNKSLEENQKLLNVTDPKAEYEKMIDNAVVYDLLTKELFELRKSLEFVNQDIRGMDEQINLDNSEKIKLIQIIENLNGEVFKLNESVEKIVPNGEPVTLKEAAITRTLEIENEFKNANEKLEKSKTEIEEKIKNLKHVEGILSKVISDLEELNVEYKDAYLREGFNEESGHKPYVIDQNKVVTLEKEITEFEDLSKKYNTLIKQLTDKLGDVTLDKSEMENILVQINELDQAIENSKKVMVELGVKLRQSSENYAKKIILDKTKIEIRKNVDILELIQKMTKGQRFVEYVAMNQMKYILREASSRLKSITMNRYTLEMNSSGNFVICDNHNGGDKRDVNTLSGGETFVASLSLALALSSKIQLKGSASMEFFVLDEGFGTLDPNMLDVVMNSLEKLRSESIAVGIISHVDELKQRIPVKLEVSPAKSGIKGTTVKLIS